MKLCFQASQKNFLLVPAFRICTGCLPKYEWNLLKIGFKTTYFQVFPGFPAIPAFSQIRQTQAKFGSILAKKGHFSNFPEKPKPQYFLDCRGQASCKKKGNSNCSFQKNAKNPHFWAFWAKKADFGPFLAKKGPFSNFRRKSENVTFLLIFFHFSIQTSRHAGSDARATQRK